MKAFETAEKRAGQ